MKALTQKSFWIAIAVSLAFIALILLSIVPQALGALTGYDAHRKYIYPVVRVTIGNIGGSGTVIYSYLENQNIGANRFTDEDKKAGISPYYSTYVLTNHHVVEGAITITEEWDTNLQKNVKKEKRSIVYVEIFKYQDISTPIGTLKVEADIVLYDNDSDLALLKLRSQESIVYIAELPDKEDLDVLLVMDESIAVGCSLGFPPIPTCGIVTRKNFQIDSLPYHMSSSQIIYGNSGGAMFNAEGQLIGVPALLPIVGWGTPITHMGLFVPIKRIYEWLDAEHYDFIFDPTVTEKDCLEKREAEIKAKKRAAK